MKNQKLNTRDGQPIAQPGIFLTFTFETKTFGITMLKIKGI